MKKLMPLRRFVVEVTNEANADDDASIRKAVKSWHNRLSNGSIPRTVVAKLGRELFLDLQAWDEWWEQKAVNNPRKSVGRPRNA